MTLDEIESALQENIKPKSVYAVYDCAVGSNTVELGVLTIASVSLAKHLKGSVRAVLLAATLGANADVLIRKYSVQNMEKAFIAQKASVKILEAYLDESVNNLSQTNEFKKLIPARRYSPGYGDFDIKYQKDILKILDAPRIGLSLTEGFMLVPVKSVTAVIGFSEAI